MFSKRFPVDANKEIPYTSTAFNSIPEMAILLGMYRTAS